MIWQTSSLILYMCIHADSLSHVWVFGTPCTVTHQPPLSMGFFRQEYWSGIPFPSPGDLPNPGIEHRSPALQVDSSPTEALGKPKNTGVGSLSLLQGIFLTQELNHGLLHCRWILTSWATRAPQTLLVSAIIWKNQGTRKEIVTNVSALGISNSLTNLSNIFLIFSGGLQENTGALSSPSF